MTDPFNFDNILNSLLSDEALGKGLTDEDKASVREMVQALSGEPQTEDSIPNEDSEVQPPTTETWDELFNALAIAPDELLQKTVLKDLITKDSDDSLLSTLSVHVDAATEVVDVLATRPVARQALSEVRRVELQLTALAIGVSDLRQALEQNGDAPRNPLLKKRFRLFFKDFGLFRRLGRGNAGIWRFALLVAIIPVPFLVRVNLPGLIHQFDQQIDQSGWSGHSNPQSFTVESIEGGVLLTQSPDQQQLRVRLKGLLLSQPWRNQAEGVLAMVLQASQAQILLMNREPQADGSVAAIATLPNGTSLQEILLTDGLAKLDAQALNGLPKDIALKLQQAEAIARQQHKNIWGEDHGSSAN